MGRAPKDTNSILIQNVCVNFISKKSDNYGNEFYYFKIVDKDKKTKFKLLQGIVATSENLKVPFFNGDNNATIIRVKEKIINSLNILEFERKTYLCDLLFEYYNFNPDGSNEVVGYYCKMPIIKLSDIQCV